MIDLEDLMSIPKNELQEASKAPDKEDLPQLVEWLTSGDDNIRYQAFLLLQIEALSGDILDKNQGNSLKLCLLAFSFCSIRVCLQRFRQTFQG